MENKKITLKLFSVHQSFKVKFTLMCKFRNKDTNNNQLPQDKKSYSYNKYIFNDAESIIVDVAKFLVFDITNPATVGENWSKNNSISFMNIQFFSLIKALEKMYRCFTEIKELFYYDGSNKLQVNKTWADKVEIRVQGCANSILLIRPCVVVINDVSYEGIMMCINSYTYYSYLTYTELEYLIFELKHLNLNELTYTAYNTMVLTCKENIYDALNN